MNRSFPKRAGGAVLILALGVVLGCSGKPSTTGESASKAPSTPASFDSDVKELMVVTGSDSVAYQMANYISATIIGSLAAQRRDVTQAQITAAKEEVDTFLAARIPALRDSLTELYKAHYTPDDVRQLIVFFKTPVGKKFAETTPIVAREGTMIGDRWGRGLSAELGQKLMARLAREGLKVQ